MLLAIRSVIQLCGSILYLVFFVLLDLITYNATNFQERKEVFVVWLEGQTLPYLARETSGFRVFSEGVCCQA